MVDLFLYFLSREGLYNSTYLLITTIGVIITFIGICVTGIFSYLLWRATKETNNLAKANYELAATVAEYQKSKEEGIKNRYRTQLWKKLQHLYYSLSCQTGVKFDFKALMEAHLNCKNHGLSDEIIGQYFSEEERFLIDTVWAQFNDYIETHWMLNGNFINTNYRTDKEEVLELNEHCLALADELNKMLLKTF